MSGAAGPAATSSRHPSRMGRVILGVRDGEFGLEAFPPLT